MHSQHYIQWAKATRVSLTIGNKTGISAFTTLINMVLEVQDTAIKQEEEIKGTHIGKKEVKLSLLPDDMILYIDNSKDTKNKTPLEEINECSEVGGYKVNIQKQVVF